MGLAISGVANQFAPPAIALLRHLPADVVFESNLDIVGPLYGPDWTLTATTLADLADLAVNSPSADLVEITNGWLRDLPEIAPGVDVPVHYALAEFDCLWSVSAERVIVFARHFRNAPFIDASLWRGTGHNIEHHRLGQAYIGSVLSFAERCAIETSRPPTWPGSDESPVRYRTLTLYLSLGVGND